MPRAILAALLLTLLYAVPSAARVGNGKIAFATEDGLLTVNFDGTGRTLLKSGSGLFSARWSPDGSRIAWGPQPAAGGDVYTADAAGGDVRRLTNDGRTTSPPSWSPTGAMLVYSKRTYYSSDSQVFVIGADGSGDRQITESNSYGNQEPTWSPNGEWIAFDGVGLSLIHPDGTGRHVVAPGNISPSWSPDGSKIVDTLVRQIGRYEIAWDIYVVDVDGSNLRKISGAAPAWSPDGERILYLGGAGLTTINADATCPIYVTSPGRIIFRSPVDGDPFSWQPIPDSPAGGRVHCHAISAMGAVTEHKASSAVIEAKVANEGTEPLTKVTLDVPAPAGGTVIAASYGCTLRRGSAKCRLSKLEPGDSRVFSLRFEARRVWLSGKPMSLKARISSTASDPLLPTGKEVAAVKFELSRCTDRSSGGGTVYGTRYAEAICGRRGADRIYPGAGSDVVKAGDGNDAIFAVDGRGYRDQISCGRGYDRAVADRGDRVGADCEQVRRR